MTQTKQNRHKILKIIAKLVGRINAHSLYMH